METTIIVLGIALAAMVIIAVFAVAYCYKLQEKHTQLWYDYNECKHELGIARDTIGSQHGKIKDLEHDLLANKQLLEKQDREILQLTNQIEELQKDNTLLGQQLAECQVPSQTTAKKETTDPKDDYIANQANWVKENNVRYGTPVKSLVEVFLFGIKKGDIGKVIKIETDYILVCFNGEIYSYYHTELEINRRKR